MSLERKKYIVLNNPSY